MNTADTYPRERLLERLLNKVTVGHQGGCALYHGALDRDGYGHITTERRGQTYRVHRLIYEFFVAPIPDGLQLDHLCRVRNCVRPDHLEVVTLKENVLRGEGISAENARKTHCWRGHEFTPENTGTTEQEGRYCRACGTVRMREWRAAKRSM